jgi:hypothetical protein
VPHVSRTFHSIAIRRKPPVKTPARGDFFITFF